MFWWTVVVRICNSTRMLYIMLSLLTSISRKFHSSNSTVMMCVKFQRDMGISIQNFGCLSIREFLLPSLLLTFAATDWFQIVGCKHSWFWHRGCRQTRYGGFTSGNLFFRMLGLKWTENGVRELTGNLNNESSQTRCNRYGDDWWCY